MTRLEAARALRTAEWIDRLLTVALALAVHELLAISWPVIVAFMAGITAACFLHFLITPVDR